MVLRLKNNSYQLLVLLLIISFLLSDKIVAQTIPLAEKQLNLEKREKLLTQDIREYSKAKRLRVSERTRFTAGYNEDGSLQSQRTFAEKIYFDERGNRVEHILLKPDSLLDKRHTFAYDANGHVIRMEIYNENDNIVFRRESVYNEKGNEISRIFHEAKTRGESKAEMKYNEKDQLIEVITYKPNGNVAGTVKLHYENDKIQSTESINEKGELLDKSILSYDEDGNIVQEIITNGKDSVTVKYTYNEQGYITSMEHFDSTRYWEYDQNGNIIEDRQFLASGERDFLVRFTYYDNGLLKEEIRYATNDQPNFYSKFEYEFYK